MISTSSVNLTSFIDYTDPAVRAGRSIVKKAVEQYGDELNIKTRFYSLHSKDENFILSAKAAIAAELQDKFIEMNNELIHHDGEYPEDLLIKMATNAGLDIEKFKYDLHSEEVDNRLKSDFELARNLRITFVPAITINGYLYKGAWDEDALMESIDRAGTKPVKQAMASFIHWGASAAVVLLLASIAALVYVNLGFIENFHHFIEMEWGISAGDFSFTMPFEKLVNDGLMAIFFLLIGLEIKREIVSGELSDRSKAAMPVIGAIGGIVVPVLIYLFINVGEEGANGWGVPMATDIAFTLGLMALLGSRVPTSLKVFISALAVTDDLGAIVVIALFYGHGFHLDAFIISAGIVLVMAVFNYMKVYSKTVYIVLGVFLWYFIYQSGLHATLAGVLTAVLIPSRRRGNLEGIASQASVIFDHEINRIKNSDNSQESIRHSALLAIQKAIGRLIGPGEQMEFSMERTVNYFILPLFAFVNTGIVIVGMQFDLFTGVNLGILLGLCLGKPLGIVGFCFIASKLKIARLSSTISWAQLTGGACLAGVGFTMSLVVATAAFEGDLLDGAKLSILVASGLSAILGLIILFTSVRKATN